MERVTSLRKRVAYYLPSATFSPLIVRSIRPVDLVCDQDWHHYKSLCRLESPERYDKAIRDDHGWFDVDAWLLSAEQVADLTAQSRTRTLLC